MEDNIKEIIGWFVSDTIELIDKVLDDDDNDPQYSAVTAVTRIQLYLTYKNELNTIEISDFLLNSGYSNEDIEILKRKYDKELPEYHAATPICKFNL